jgi:1-pyrroline-5-carboxylate dehydrogenase
MWMHCSQFQVRNCFSGVLIIVIIKLGKPVEKTLHTIPECYGSYYPTAVFVPLEQIRKEEYFELVTCEVFGPLQVVTEYDDTKENGIDVVLEILEKY